MENGRCLLNQSVVKARRLRCVWLYALSGSGGPELEKIGQTSGPLNILGPVSYTHLTLPTILLV